MTFNVEAFIKEHEFDAYDSAPGPELGPCLGSCMTSDSVRALVAQLLPPGHVVIALDDLRAVLPLVKRPPLPDHLGDWVEHAQRMAPIERLSQIAADSTLPASSGPEQTKDGCGVPQSVIDEIAGVDAKDRAEPKCVCDPVEFIPRMHTICRTPNYFKGRCTCGHPPECHTPAPAAKEVMPRSD